MTGASVHGIANGNPPCAPNRRHWSDFVGCFSLCALAGWVVVSAPSLSLALVPVVGYDVASGLVFLIRGRARASDSGLGARIAAYGGTFLFVAFLGAATAWAPGWITPLTHSFPAGARWAVPISNVLIAAGGTLSAWGLWHLRASFSLEPAARSLVTSGPYAIVRHPLYLAYTMSYSGIALQHPTGPTTSVLVA
jgi:hypothetical protein